MKITICVKIEDIKNSFRTSELVFNSSPLSWPDTWLKKNWKIVTPILHTVCYLQGINPLKENIKTLVYLSFLSKDTILTIYTKPNCHVSLHRLITIWPLLPKHCPARKHICRTTSLLLKATCTCERAVPINREDYRKKVV